MTQRRTSSRGVIWAAVRARPSLSCFHVYVFYTDEGKPYMGFVDSGEPRISEFETGNGGYRYVRVR